MWPKCPKPSWRRRGSGGIFLGNYWELGEMPGPLVGASELQVRTKIASRVFSKYWRCGGREWREGQYRHWEDPQGEDSLQCLSEG